jgi:hypothetical protein
MNKIQRMGVKVKVRAFEISRSGEAKKVIHTQYRINQGKMAENGQITYRVVWTKRDSRKSEIFYDYSLFSVI